MHMPGEDLSEGRPTRLIANSGVRMSGNSLSTNSEASRQKNSQMVEIVDFMIANISDNAHRPEDRLMTTTSLSKLHPHYL
jgi:hypothetical protein